jgi:ubiquinone/menaquinone biosynthesis C-methylase UbiE
LFCYAAGVLRSSAIFQLASLPYELLARAPVWDRHCAEMAEQLPPGARHVLDLGCGPGNSTAHLRNKVGPGAIGGDLAPSMLRRARKRDRTLALASLDAAALPVRSGSLDAVTFHSVLYLLPDQPAALREVFRVLRSGGRAILLEPQEGLRATLLGMARALPTPRWALTALMWRTMSLAYGRFTADGLWAALESSGLRVKKIEESLGGLGLLAVAEKP